MRANGDSCGAYGLEVVGLPDPGLLIPIQSGTWPSVSIRVEATDWTESLTEIGEEHATLKLDGGESAVLRRRERSAVLATTKGSDPGRIIHPLFTAAGTVFAW